MNITSQPLALSMSGNILPIVIQTTEDFTLSLLKDGAEIISHTYNPGSSGVVSIKMRDIVEAQLAYTLKDATASYLQTAIYGKFTVNMVSATESKSISFIAIRSGVDQLSVTPPDFLTANFLTWQPTTKYVTYYTPEYLTYYAVRDCKAVLKATFSDLTTTKIDLAAGIASGTCITLALTYGVVSGLLDSKLPSFYDVWMEDTNGNRLSFIQRYVASEYLTEQEQWVIFENSLGGVDTFRAFGAVEFTGEHTHNLAEIDEVSEEYRVDTKRKFKKYTGHLSTYERKWLLDFFPSKGKYLYATNSLRKIVVVESDVTCSNVEQAGGYSFTYQYADALPLLNLTRNESLPDNITVDVPDLGNFTLPPRLIDFPAISLAEGALFPIQSPYSEKWGRTTLSEILSYFSTAISGGSDPSDLFNLFIAKIGELAISRVKDDSASGTITFLKGLKLGTGNSSVYEDANGDWHLDIGFISVDKKLEANEVDIQHATHIGGRLLNTAADMICSSIEAVSDVLYKCYFKTTDSDGNTISNLFAADDQAYCETFNLSAANHYYWVRVLSVGDDFIELSYSAGDFATGSDKPKAGDRIVQLGNKTDTARQNAIIEASTGTGSPFIRLYKGIKTFTLPDPLIDLNADNPVIKAKLYNSASDKSVDEELTALASSVSDISDKAQTYFTIWFGEVAPTSALEPESDWTTDALKELHLEDWYYDTAHGLAYRYELNATTNAYYWNVISDKDTVAALEKASQAVAAADKKIQCFTSQPTDADSYDVGDIWVNATYKNADGTDLYNNDSLVCITAKAAGDTFNISAWQPASNATTATITNLGKQISLCVKAEDLMTTITQKIDEIKLALYGKDSKGALNTLISAVNLDSSGVQISGELVKITGTLLAQIIKASGLEIADSDGIVNFKVGKDGKITAVSTTLTGDINAVSGKIGNLKITSSGALAGGNAKFDDITSYYDLPGNDGTMEQYISSAIAKMTTIILYKTAFSANNTLTCYLPTIAQMTALGLNSYGISIKLIAVNAFSSNSTASNYTTTHRITSNASGTGELKDSSNSRIEYIDMTPGDILDLYYFHGQYLINNKNF